MPKDRDTRVDRWLERLKNNKLVAVIVVLSIIIIGAGQLRSSIADIVNPLFSHEPESLNAQDIAKRFLGTLSPAESNNVLEGVRELLRSGKPMEREIAVEQLALTLSKFQKQTDPSGPGYQYRNQRKSMLRLIKSYGKQPLFHYFGEDTFTDSNLIQFDFSNSDLSFLRFSSSFLRAVDFTNADLRGANFYDTYLVEADFKGANIDGVNFEEADWFNAFNLDIDRLPVQMRRKMISCPDTEGEFQSQYVAWYKQDYLEMSNSQRDALKKLWSFNRAKNGPCERIGSAAR